MRKQNKQTPATPENSLSVESAIEQLFQIKNQVSELKVEEEKLQEVIDNYANEHYSEFVDGQLVLETGIIRVHQNPPKLVHKGSEKSLTPTQRLELTQELKKEYVHLKPNLTKMIARVNSDKLLKQFLLARGAEIVQGSKYVVKPF